jgi:hypothetical protein
MGIVGEWVRLWTSSINKSHDNEDRQKYQAHTSNIINHKVLKTSPSPINFDSFKTQT